jgi:endonuclease YncB( thermonuclease family)
MRFVRVVVWSSVLAIASSLACGQGKVSREDYSVGPRAARDRLPRNYNYYYDNQRTQYALTPIIVPNPVTQSPIILGPVRPYSDEEYSRLLLSTMNVGNVAPTSSKLETRSLLVPVEGEGGRHFRRAEARVLDVLDRGILLAETREEVRLRGVRMVSDRDSDEVRRYYAREGARVLRSLTTNENVFFEFGEPLRDRDGNLLAMLYLRDGTQLNKLVLEQGLGYLEAKDFPDDADLSDLVSAEKAARNGKAGVWSR